MTLDGVPNASTLTSITASTGGLTAARTPEVPSVPPFNVYAAYGGAGGGTVEITTRGGSNQLHGAASEFNQASKLAATPFFTNASGGQKVVTRQNQWGATLGGPVYIPKVFNGKNKVFFFGYEGYKDSAPNPTFSTVPTAAERNGDFSALPALNTKGKDYTLYDPNTGKVSGSSVVRTPFPNNVMPQSRIHPIAVSNLLRPFPEFSGVTESNMNNGGSYYHSANVRIQRRFNNGLQMSSTTTIRA